MTSTMAPAQPLEKPVQAQHAGVVEAPTPIAAPNLGTTAAQAGSTADIAQSAPSGVNSALASKITQAISMGLAQAPTDAAGWAKLEDFYSTTAGQNQLLTQGQSAPTAASTNPAVSAYLTSLNAQTTQPTQGALGTNAFLAAIRQHESGGDYTAENKAGGASGAYQFIQSTWSSEAKAAGFAQYAGGPASAAPPSVQDAVAAHMANGYYSTYGNWNEAAQAWYMPADVGKNVVPDPQAGNKESVTAYGNQIVQMMGQQPNLDPQHPAAGSTDAVVKIAQSQIGVPYQWGAESPGKAFDCSALVQWTYKQAGVSLPRVAQAQYNATAKIAKGAPLQPGDLMFFGSGPHGIEHVGIYIGNGQMIDAPHTGADVRIDNNPMGWANYVGATRPGDHTGVTTVAPQSQHAGIIAQSQQNFGAIMEQVTHQLGSLLGART